MKIKRWDLTKICLLLFSTFGVLTNSYADCQPVTLSIINQQDHAVTILHAGNDITVPANSSGRYAVVPKAFYTKDCSSLALRTEQDASNQEAHVAFIGNEQNIAVRVDTDGTIESNLDDNASFNVEKVMPYHGVGSYLS